MSFASDVKEEIIRNELTDSCKKAQLSALLQLLASITINKKGLSLVFKSTNSSLIKMMSLDLQSLYGVKPELIAIKQTNLDKKNAYQLTVSESVKDILYDLDLWTEKGLQDHPRLMFLNTDEMLRCYLAGCFLATGSVNSPRTTSYHAEIKANSESHGQFLLKILEKFYIKAKMTTRRSNYIIYIKKSEQIADFLKLVNAHNAVMDFEDIRIQRDFMNNLYRLDNIKIANDQKAQAVADKQLEALQYLQDNDLLKYLSPKIIQIANLRLDNPDASLQELSDIFYEESGEMLSKSGIRHRFDKIQELYEKYYNKDKDKK